MGEDIRNNNVFLIDEGYYDELPKVYSSFQKAEESLLAKIKALNPCRFSRPVIACIQINTNRVRQISYSGNIKIKDGFKYITIERDKNNVNGYKKTHHEKIRVDLDY